MELLNNPGIAQEIPEAFTGTNYSESFKHLSRAFKVYTIPSYAFPPKGYGGLIALISAAGSASSQCVELLLREGADVNTPDNAGNTPLIEAVYGNTEINHKCRTGEIEGDPMSLITDTNRETVKCCKLLLEAGANVSAANSYGTTALMAAASSARFSCMKLLLEAGADVNGGCRGNNTALMYAAGTNNLRCVYLLLQAGAHVQIYSALNINCLERQIFESSRYEETSPESSHLSLTLFAAGEIIRDRYVTFKDGYGDIATVEIPEFLLRLVEPKMCLKDRCLQKSGTNAYVPW